MKSNISFHFMVLTFSDISRKSLYTSRPWRYGFSVEFIFLAFKVRCLMDFKLTFAYYLEELIFTFSFSCYRTICWFLFPHWIALHFWWKLFLQVLFLNAAFVSIELCFSLHIKTIVCNYKDFLEILKFRQWQFPRHILFKKMFYC